MYGVYLNLVHEWESLHIAIIVISEGYLGKQYCQNC